MPKIKWPSERERPAARHIFCRWNYTLVFTVKPPKGSEFSGVVARNGWCGADKGSS